MPIRDNTEVKQALMLLVPKIPAELQEEYMQIAIEPTPQAAYKVSQFIYLHRADLPNDVVQIGRDLIHYTAVDYQWAGFVETGLAQIPYMDKILGVGGHDDLDEDGAPDVHAGAGIKMPDPSPAAALPSEQA